MHLAAIQTYPVKGCYRLEHELAEVEPWGLVGDRRWLIVDADSGRAVTQREHPGLTQIRPAARKDAAGLVLRTPGLADLTVAEPLDGEWSEVAVHSYTGRARRAGPVADDWLSTALERKVRLVWQDDPTRRPVAPPYGRSGDTVAFADAYPLLLANQASLHALNDLIAQDAVAGWADAPTQPLPMTRFRPNLVIAGAAAWAEDAWAGERIRIGEVTFRVGEPCGRCVVTTTDQETGERGREPLRTLARYRTVNQKVLFATNLIPEHRGSVAVGDPVRA